MRPVLVFAFVTQRFRVATTAAGVAVLLGIACGGGGGCNVGTDPACPASTTTSITSHEPNPSVVGQTLTVRYSVTSPSGTPAGSVTIADGAASCSGAVSAGTC